MSPIVVAVVLLLCSNIFMTFAWYGHLKHLGGSPWVIAALVSWGITLLVFVPFSVLYMREALRLDFLWAGLCICGAVYFVFRGTGV